MPSVLIFLIFLVCGQCLEANPVGNEQGLSVHKLIKRAIISDNWVSNARNINPTRQAAVENIISRPLKPNEHIIFRHGPLESYDLKLLCKLPQSGWTAEIGYYSFDRESFYEGSTREGLIERFGSRTVMQFTPHKRRKKGGISRD